MSNSYAPESNNAPTGPAAQAKEPRLRGPEWVGADQKIAVDHVVYEKSRNPDAQLRVDGEDDTLYNDGLDIGDDSGPPAGTDGNRPKGIKG
jgi:hypothetical protein